MIDCKCGHPFGWHDDRAVAACVDGTRSNNASPPADRCWCLGYEASA